MYNSKRRKYSRRRRPSTRKRRPSTRKRRPSTRKRKIYRKRRPSTRRRRNKRLKGGALKQGREGATPPPPISPIDEELLEVRIMFNESDPLNQNVKIFTEIPGFSTFTSDQITNLKNIYKILIGERFGYDNKEAQAIYLELKGTDKLVSWDKFEEWLKARVNAEPEPE